MNTSELLTLDQFVGNLKKSDSTYHGINYELCDDEPAFDFAIKQPRVGGLLDSNTVYHDGGEIRFYVYREYYSFLHHEFNTRFFVSHDKRVEYCCFQVGEDKNNVLEVAVLNGKVRSAMITFFPSCDFSSYYQEPCHYINFTQPFSESFKALLEPALLGRRTIIKEYRKELNGIRQKHKDYMKQYNDFINLFK